MPLELARRALAELMQLIGGIVGVLVVRVLFPHSAERAAAFATEEARSA